MKRGVVALLLAGATLTAPHSASAKPKEITAAELGAMQPGVTTYAEVVHELGEPTSESFGSGGLRVIAYATTKTHVKAATFIPYVGMFAGGATAKTTWVTLSFDQDEHLVAYQSTTSSADCSTSIFGPGCSGGMPATAPPAPAAGPTATAPTAVAVTASSGGVVLGVQFTDVPAVLSTMIGRPGLNAALISNVYPGSIAAKAGVAQGDVVTSYAGKTIGGHDDLLAAVHATKPGDAVALGIIRGGKDQTLSLAF